MENTTTLMVIDPDTTDAILSPLMETACDNATHLNILILSGAPALPVYAYGTPPYGGMNIPDDWGAALNTSRKALVQRKKAVEALLAKSGASGQLTPILCATMDVKNIVARHARVSDIVHVVTENIDIRREAANGVLFRSPVGLMLNGSPSTPKENVFVAWNASPAAAAAVHAALPYLCAAKSVTIGCFDPIADDAHEGADPGTDVAAWLSHHGCNVTVGQYPTGGKEVADCVTERASEIGADLVVMGAYGHARLIQTVFGGTTRSMMSQSDVPVLLAH